MTGSWTDENCCSVACRVRPPGYIEQLPSGSWRAKVYAGKDPLTGREIRFRMIGKTETEALIELGRPVELARAGRQPDSDVTVAELLDQYVPVAGWDLSTRETNLGFDLSRGHCRWPYAARQTPRRRVSPWRGTWVNGTKLCQRIAFWWVILSISASRHVVLGQDVP